MASVVLGNSGVVTPLPLTSFKDKLHEKVPAIAVFNKHMPELELVEKGNSLKGKVDLLRLRESMDTSLGFFLEGASLVSIVGLGVLFGAGAGTATVVVAMIGMAVLGSYIRMSANSSLLPGAFLGALGPLIGRALPVALVASEAGLNFMMSCTFIGGIAFCALKRYSSQKELSSAKKDIETAKEILYMAINVNKGELSGRIQKSILEFTGLLETAQQSLKDPLLESNDGSSLQDLRSEQIRELCRIENNLYNARAALELLGQFP